jgi:hypothetical protein
VRLGGIYGLGEIAKESAELHGPIVEVLCAYVRTRAAFSPPPADTLPPDVSQLVAGTEFDERMPGVDDAGELPVEIQAVMTVLLRRRADHDDTSGVRLDLSGADLRRVQAIGLRAVKASFAGAMLDRAFLWDADLREANLAAFLRGAFLNDSDLRGAHLGGATLTAAFLRGAKLAGASLPGKLTAVTSRARTCARRGSPETRP